MPRASATLVRALDPAVTAARQLDYFTYFLLQDGRPLLDSQWKTLETLDAERFKVNPYRKKCGGLDDLLGHTPADPDRPTCAFHPTGFTTARAERLG